MGSIITKPPGLRSGNCCYVCKHFEIQKEVCKKYLKDTLLYLVCDGFETKSAYERYLDRINVRGNKLKIGILSLGSKY